MSLSKQLVKDALPTAFAQDKWEQLVRDFRASLLYEAEEHLIDPVSRRINRLFPVRYLQDLGLSRDRIEVTMILNNLSDPHEFEHRRSIMIPAVSSISSLVARHKALLDKQKGTLITK